MTDRHSKHNRDASVSEIRPLRESGEVILLTVATILGVLWAIVLVTHFYGPLSGFGQSLWLMR